MMEEHLREKMSAFVVHIKLAFFIFFFIFFTPTRKRKNFTSNSNEGGEKGAIINTFTNVKFSNFLKFFAG